MNEIEKYYNKFNENKRLSTRHGIVEFTISMEYIKKYLPIKAKILDVGAGTGKYSVALFNEGYDVTAVELVKKNLSVLKEHSPTLPAYLGNALNLKKFKDKSFDAVILFGPLYHLHTNEEKIKALQEAKRVTKKGGIIFVAHILSNYAILRHGFMDKNIIEAINNGKVDIKFNLNSTEEDLYSYVTLEQIEKLNTMVSLKRIELISPDGPTDYIRPYVNKLSEKEFELYINFVRQNSNNTSTIGASSHLVDILKV